MQRYPWFLKPVLRDLLVVMEDRMTGALFVCTECGAMAGLMAGACRFCGSETKAIDADGNLMDSTNDAHIRAGAFHCLPVDARACRCGRLVASADAEG